MLLERAGYEEPVPVCGLRYRDACAEVLGDDVAAAVEAEWRRQEFIVP